MKVNVYTDVAPYLSMCWVAEQVVKGLLQRGVQVSTVALDRDVRMAQLDATLALTLGEAVEGALEVVVRPVVRLTPELCEDRVVVTLWESDELPTEAVMALNLARGVVVATRWLRGVMRACGVKKPVSVARYGVDEVYEHSMAEFPKRTVFLTAGRTAHGRVRKGVDLVQAAFLLAFPNEKDVVLQVKTHEDCALMDMACSRVQVIKGWWPKKVQAEWYRQGLCYVSGAAAEGWGLHQHEAMACGKPVIGVNWGGVTEFFRPGENGYAVRHKMVESEMEAGRWPKLDVEHMAELMRFVYEEPVHAFMTGLMAAKSVEPLTIEAMQKAHAVEVLKYG